MKQIDKEQKVVYQVYQAVDGTEFDSSEECQKYEKSAKCVLNERYRKLIVTTTTEYDLFSTGSEDCIVDIVKVSTPRDADTIKQLLFLHNPYLEKAEFENMKNNDMDIIDSAYKDNSLLFIGFGCDGDNFYIIDTKKRIISHINEMCNEADSEGV